MRPRPRLQRKATPGRARDGQAGDGRTRTKRLARLGGAFGALTFLVLVAFHAQLLARRVLDGSILEPAIALQWAGAVVLLGVLAHLRRQGVALLRGRTALAFWLLVLVLHLVPATPAAPLDREHTDLLLVLPAAWVVSLVVFLSALGALLGARLPRPRRATRRDDRRRGPPALLPGVDPRRFARPPPPHPIG